MIKPRGYTSCHTSMQAPIAPLRPLHGSTSTSRPLLRAQNSSSDREETSQPLPSSTPSSSSPSFPTPPLPSSGANGGSAAVSPGGVLPASVQGGSGINPGALAGSAVAVAVAAFAIGRVFTGDVTLSTLAKESTPLEIALTNGKPTLIEFYADWCEVCKSLVKDEIKVERKYRGDVNFVMLNIDNSKWQPEMDEYHVGGVPHFVFMDTKANPLAAAVGKIPISILESNISAMSGGKTLPYLAPPTRETSEVLEGKMTKAMASRSTQASPLDHSSSPPTSSPLSLSPVAIGSEDDTLGSPREINGGSFYDFKVNDIDGRSFQMDAFKGKVVLVVNLASACGYTPQYKELESLYEKLGPRGFVVAGFPCNQFGNQESGSNEDIKSFARTKYGVTFPLFSKVNVNGPEADPLFGFLKSQRGGDHDVRWNFAKFLVDRQGNVVNRYSSNMSPFEIESDISELLG